MRRAEKAGCFWHNSYSNKANHGAKKLKKWRNLQIKLIFYEISACGQVPGGFQRVDIRE